MRAEDCYGRHPFDRPTTCPACCPCLDAVEAPWSRREENQLRLEWNKDFETLQAKGRALVEEIERIGAEPFRPPEPLPPIEASETHLICWLAIQPVDT